MTPKRYFAIVTSNGFGYALDYYPDTEYRAYLAEMGDSIIGDYATAEEAEAAMIEALRKSPGARVQ